MGSIFLQCKCPRQWERGLTEDDILGGAGQAFDGGWNKVKLYFMLGLPTETEEDMRAIPAPFGNVMPFSVFF